MEWDEGPKRQLGTLLDQAPARIKGNPGEIPAQNACRLAAEFLRRQIPEMRERRTGRLHEARAVCPYPHHRTIPRGYGMPGPASP